MVEAVAEPRQEVANEEAEERGAKKIKLETLESELNEKIVKQMEYYFSDVNVIKDKFLLEEFKKNDGWVKLSVLATFSRLKQLSDKEDRLLEALKATPSESLQFNEGEKSVKRKIPLPDVQEYQKELESRTLHISGFPTDYNFESLKKFCTQFGPVESVAMRRHFKTRFFKGCIHVVFENKADVKKVLDTNVLKCKDRELRVETMDKYHTRKEEMREKRKLDKKSKTKEKKDPSTDPSK